MQKLIIHCVMFAMGLLISSCSTRMYAPTTIQTPLFREKKEIQVSGILGKGADANCSEIQGAIAITSTLALIGSYYYVEGIHHIHDDGSGPIEPDRAGKGKQFELGAGYFKTLNKVTSFETYLGFANGQVVNYYGRDYYLGPNRSLYYADVELMNKVFKPFAQFNIGYRSPNYDFIFSTRLSLRHFYEITEEVNIPTEWIHWEGYTVYQTHFVREMKSKPNAFLFEPGLTFRIGVEPIKLHLHLGLSLNSKSYYQEKFILSVGLTSKLYSSIMKDED